MDPGKSITSSSSPVSGSETGSECVSSTVMIHPPDVVSSEICENPVEKSPEKIEVERSENPAENDEKPACEQKPKKSVRIHDSDEVISTTKEEEDDDDQSSKVQAHLKPSPSVHVMESHHEQEISANRSINSDNSSSGNALVEEAWENLKKSVGLFNGIPVGTLAALDHSVEALNYNQVFVRDFVPSDLAYMMQSKDSKPELQIVKNFLLKTLHLQSWENEKSSRKRKRGRERDMISKLSGGQSQPQPQHQSSSSSSSSSCNPHPTGPNLSSTANPYIPIWYNNNPPPPPPQPPILPPPPFQPGVVHNQDSHLVIALTIQKGMLKSWNLDVSSAADEVKLHGLFGNGLGTYHAPPFQTDFGGIPDLRELTIRLLCCWKALEKKGPNHSYVSHYETPWRREYDGHATEVFMTQEDYFRYTLDVLDLLAPVVNRLLKDCCIMLGFDVFGGSMGPYHRDGRRLLKVVDFERGCRLAGLPPPTLHVRRFQGPSGCTEQELVDLKFYINPFSQTFMVCPQSRRSSSLSNTPGSLNPYDSTLPLFLV